ncbi:MAG: hypothetical protein K2N30_02500 [Clostridia bacterium]|nr:hypothetical protein [Clostridia bacterium]
MRNFPGIILKLNFWIILLIAVQITAIIFLCLYIPAILPLAFALVLVWLLSAVSATLLFTRSGAPEVKCVWFVIIAAVPVAGALVYLIVSIKSKPCGILKVTDATARGLELAANRTCGTVGAGYYRAVYFSSGTEFFNCALQTVKNAKKSVYIEFFIISRGHIFSALCEALDKAVKNGAEVKIICDGVGSAFRLGKKDLKRLRAAGAEIKIFHKLVPLANSGLNARDHRKIITVDGETAFTGGINLADEYANISSPYGYWKDNGAVIYGSAAKIFEGMFLSMWQGGCEMAAPAPPAKQKVRCRTY